MLLIGMAGALLLLALIARAGANKTDSPSSGVGAEIDFLDSIDGEPYVPDKSEGSVTSQRDKMRELYKQNAGDEQRTIAAYAAAERRGEVSRRSNDYGLNAEEYARRLLADGVRKGWIT